MFGCVFVNVRFERWCDEFFIVNGGFKFSEVLFYGGGYLFLVLGYVVCFSLNLVLIISE